MAIDKSNFDNQEKQPLPKAPNTIDPGKSPDGSESAILNPSQGMHTTKPTPGNEVPGQVSKM
jgi:hypothetical protein